MRKELPRRRVGTSAAEAVENGGIPDIGVPHKPSSKMGSPGRYSDASSIALLCLLYTLQGIPMGLHGSVPLLLAKKVGYKDQALFSLCSWPFSLKLLWAPIVDSIYLEQLGRRKSWLVPVQLLCGAMMVVGAQYIDGWVAEGTDEPPAVQTLTAYFFLLYFLMATQDIAVDGWALTMLSQKNVGYASTCNTIGQTVGYFIAYIGFLTLNDPATSNAYFRSTPLEDQGLVSLGGFVGFWGWVFLVTTLYVWFCKPEDMTASSDSSGTRSRPRTPPSFSSSSSPPTSLSTTAAAWASVRQTYRELWTVLRLPPMRLLVLVLLTCKIGFAVTEAATSLKFVEYGVPKEQMATFAPLLVGVGIVVPLVVGRYTNGPRPLSLFVYGMPLRMVAGAVVAGALHVTHSIYSQKEQVQPPMWFWMFIVACISLSSVGSNLMFVSQMSFFAKISDPAIGGTYMTLLNTIANLGSKWPVSLSLMLLDDMTTIECIGLTTAGEEAEPVIWSELPCDAPDARSPCTDGGGRCETTSDGYYTQFAICTALGILWLVLFGNRTLKLQTLDSAAWRISRAPE